MDLVVLILAILYLCIRSTGLGIAMAIAAIGYVVIRTIADLAKKGK